MVDSRPVLVLDSGAFFHASDIASRYGPETRYLSTPSVKSELMDERSHRAFASFPFGIELVEPKPEALVAIVESSKLLGEFYEFSTTDLEILALVWEHSTARGWQPKASSSRDAKTNQGKQHSEGVRFSDAFKARKFDLNQLLEEKLQGSSLEGESREENPKIEESERIAERTEKVTSEVVRDCGSDGEGEWMTLDKLEACAAERPKLTVDVALMTSDFAMQNFSMKLGLNLALIAGRSLTRVRSIIKGCYSCNYLVHDLSKEFCPRCGNHTLNKVAVSKNGFCRWIKSNALESPRGKVFSIPKSKGGRSYSDVILREDELEAARERARRGYTRSSKKTSRNDLFEESALFGVSKSVQIKNGPQYGHSKKNPNERCRRR